MARGIWGKSKVIIDGNEEKEKRADQFALRMMIRDDIWKQVLETNLNEEKLENISEKNKIPMSFIVGRLAKIVKISYRSKLYRENFQK